MNCLDCEKETGTKSQRCPKCQQIYHQKWLEKLKFWAVHKLGDKCSRCGKQFDLCCYDFHHVGEKSWSNTEHINGINTQTGASNYRTKELTKWRKENKIPEDVRLVCSNCHRIIEKELRK